MKNLAVGVLCPIVLVLTACGGGGSSGSKPKSSSSAAMVSSAAPVSSAAAVSSVTPASSAAAVSSAAVSSSGAVVSSSSESSVSSSAASSQVVSSSAASSSSSVVAQTGVFVDSAVAGIKYVTAPSGLTGYTSLTGQYQYVEGDKVVFSIGDLLFPEVTAKGVVTPVDIAAEADPANAMRIQLNIAALLQSLDTDGNPDNGISIDYDTASAVAAAVNFNQSYADFAASPAVTTLVASSGSTLVSESAALAHLEGSLADLKAKSLIGTWYINGYDEVEDTEYSYVLFVLDEHHYAFIDQYGEDSELEVGTYSWNLETGVVTTEIDFETENVLDSYPPMATGNTLEVDGDTLTFTDEDEVFVATRLKSSEESPLKGGWFIGNEVVFAFTDTHYFMGQYSEPEEDSNGYPGVEIGTYNYNGATKAIIYSTLLDTNGQWGLSHPCAIISDDAHPQYENSNFFNCGPNGAAILQTMEVTGDTLTFISEADTIANNGDEEPVAMERVVDGIPDGDIHLRLELTLTLTEYQQGQLFNPEGATMQCDLNQAPTVGDTETLWESWVIGGGPGRKSWISSEEATYDPETGELTLDIQEDWAPITGHPGFWESWTDTVDLTYQPGQENVIVGTVTEVNNLSWDRNREQVSTCTSTYTVVGKLRPVAEPEPLP